MVVQVRAVVSEQVQPSVSPPLVQVRAVVSELVQPSVSPPCPHGYSTVIRSSNLDLVIANTYIKTIYFFSPINDDQFSSDFFSADVLTQSLSHALSIYYPMAGRLIRAGERSIEIACNGAGALFVRARADCSVDELQGFEPKPEFLQLVPTLESFNDESSWPLLIVQVTTFECGGVSLGIGIEHHVADGMSAIDFLNAWSGIARGKAVEIQPCFDRVWLQARSPPAPRYPHEEYLSLPQPKATSNGSTRSTTPPDHTVRMIDISKEFLQEMKKRCCSTTPFSTYELLAAHVWRCACKARQLSASDEETKLIMAVDGRSRLCQPRLPDGYFGNVVFTSCSTGTAAQVSASLESTAEMIRQNLRRMDDAYCRSAIDFLELQPDLSKFVKGAHTFACPHLGFISWTKLRMYDCDFGWGKPIHVGPAFLPGEGIAYVMSSPANDGSFRLFMSLQSQHMQAFSDLILELQV